MITATANEDGTVDLVGKQGTTWSLPVQLFQDEAGTIPLEIAGTYEARGSCKKMYTTVLPFLTFTCEVPAIDVDDNPNGNLILITAKPSDSSAIKDTTGVYDVEIFTSDLEGEDVIVERVLEGTITITPEVTKPIPV